MEAIQPGCVSTYITAGQQQEIGQDSSGGVDSSRYEQVDLSESVKCSTTTAECAQTKDGERETTYQQPSSDYLDQNLEDNSSIENSNSIEIDAALYEDIPLYDIERSTYYFTTPQPGSPPLLAQPDTRVPLPPQQCISVLAPPPLPAQRSTQHSTQVPIPGCHVFPTSVQRNIHSPSLSPKPGSRVPPPFVLPFVTSPPVLSEENPSSTLEPGQFGADQLQSLANMYDTLGKFLGRSASTPVNLASSSSFRPQNVPDSNENPPLLSGYENIYDEVEQSGATKLLQNTSEQPKPPVPKPRKSKLKVSQTPHHLEAAAQGKPYEYPC